jgi:hypothetical protein
MSFVNKNKQIEGISGSSVLKMETVCFPEMLVSMCESTWRHKPEEQNQQENEESLWTLCYVLHKDVSNSIFILYIISCRDVYKKLTF